ncbi:hypothetical protein, partial [Microbulbifer sp. TYP-18]|uniref:hypothetical protein n=1 Tax=Microbulbifer sp. TYP-18 TaxID=3230024 RepID=UPI0034C61D0D
MRETPWDPATRVHRTGFVTWRDEKSVPLLKLAATLAEKHRIPLEYDLRYHGDGGAFTVTECMAGLGGIILTPTKIEQALARYRQADQCNTRHDWAPVAKAAPDKYLLHSYQTELPSKVALLPGSNLMAAGAMDLEMLRAAVAAGAFIKPHPVTNQKYRAILKRSWRDRILPRIYSGMACLRAATEIWSSGASELLLYAILARKRVHSLSNAIPAGGYWELGEYLRSVTDPKASLERILSAPEVSGVFVPNPYFDVRER